MGKLDDITRVFRTTISDRKFSRSEKQAVSRLLDSDYSLNKEEREQLRNILFELARQALDGRENKKVLDWLETANKLLLHPHDSGVYFSPGRQCREAIAEELNRAALSVDICVFTISDNRLSEAILDCHNRGVKVRIITDNDKTEDRGSDIYNLAARGITVRVDNTPHHMHHKFAVFDRKRLLTGSYNWTRTAAECNHENILLSDDQRIVSPFRTEFDSLWDQLKNFQL